MTKSVKFQKNYQLSNSPVLWIQTILIRIRIMLFNFDTDPDPAFHFDMDKDPDILYGSGSDPYLF
jgi:hypothetical protein